MRKMSASAAAQMRIDDVFVRFQSCWGGGISLFVAVFWPLREGGPCTVTVSGGDEFHLDQTTLDEAPAPHRHPKRRIRPAQGTKQDHHRHLRGARARRCLLGTI